MKKCKGYFNNNYSEMTFNDDTTVTINPANMSIGYTLSADEYAGLAYNGFIYLVNGQ